MGEKSHITDKNRILWRNRFGEAAETASPTGLSTRAARPQHHSGRVVRSSDVTSARGRRAGSANLKQLEDESTTLGQAN